MASTCIRKLQNGSFYNCELGVSGIDYMYIIDKNDLIGFTVVDDATTKRVTAIEVKPTSTYGIGGWGASSNVVDALKVTDNSKMLDSTVSFRMYYKDGRAGGFLEGLQNKLFVVFVKYKETGVLRAVGLYNGLELSAFDMEANANGGFASISLKTPDASPGESYMFAVQLVWDALVANTGAVDSPTT